MRELHTRMHRHHGTTRFACVLCGRHYKQATAAVGLFRGDEELGDVCPSCLEAGPAGAAERAKEWAAALRSRAAGVVALASEIAVIAPWHTVEELRREEAEAHDELIADLSAAELRHVEHYDEHDQDYEELLLHALI